MTQVPTLRVARPSDRLGELTGQAAAARRHPYAKASGSEALRRAT